MSTSPVPRPILGDDFDDVLKEAQRGTCSACTRVYESLAPPVAGYLRTQGANEPDDLTSEVFLRVLSGCGSFSGDEAQFRPGSSPSPTAAWWTPGEPGTGRLR